ncbi:DUF4349 domain-containing protein [Methanocalculus sp.]|uniref:DUF4349 domain-containing protein n=1 Tax=Methanocalculus sp. TaxID=2004547 RepID=UPI00260D388F|nr:DUF4349 domain-containing protein [Methanocalculus sp.]MDG6249635.1 DUF4349 domain-containing protein [Methanocalculus sp.]
MKKTLIPLLLLLLIGLSASAGCMMADSGYQSAPVMTESVVAYDRNMAADSAVAYPNQKVIKDGWLRLQARDTRVASEEITAIAARYHGRIQSLSLTSGGMSDGREQFSAHIVLRVPSDSFDAVMQEIESVGTLTQREVKSRDVTAEYTDLHAEKRALENQVNRLTEILDKAETVEEILKVQTAIDSAQLNLDRVTGRLKLLESQIDEAAITVSIREGEPLGIDSGFSITSIVNTGIAAFLFMIGIIIVAVFALLPLVVIGGVAWYIVKKRRG